MLIIEDTDYTQVPGNFLYCQRESCPKAATCLRQMAYAHISSDKQSAIFVNPKWLDAHKEPCSHYLDNQPVRYARGFMRIINAVPTGQAYSLRSRLMSYFGRKNYYLSRRGARLLLPQEQQAVIKIARQFNIQLDDYFDNYEYHLNWGTTLK